MSNFHDAPAGGGRKGVLALVAAAVLVGTFLIGRGLGAATHDTAAPEVPTPAVTVTAPPPASPSIPLTGGGPGPHRHDAGVLVGYPDTRAGAVAAAGNYLSVLYVHTNRTLVREQQVLRAISASGEDAVRMAGDLSSEDAALSRLLAVTDLQSAGVIAHGRVTGYRVESYTAGAATVDVHVAGGQGLAAAAAGSPAAGRTFYEVDRLQLVRRGGDWKLQNVSRLVSGGPDLGSIAAQGYTPFPVAPTGGEM